MSPSSLPSKTSLIAAAALALIEDPARHTTKAGSVDAQGQNVAGATDAAVAWSVFGAVGRVTVLDFNTVGYVEPWQALTRTMLDMGLTHQTSHSEAVAALKDLSSPLDTGRGQCLVS